jgi:hypothetical protein
LSEGKLKRKLAVNIITISFLIFIFGCSGPKVVEKGGRVEGKKEEVKAPIVVKNIDANERNYISSNKIKEIDKVEFDLNASGHAESGEKLSDVYYDSNGVITKTISYGNNSKVLFTYNYKYDKGGKRTETLRKIPSGTVDKDYTYGYNKYGNKIKSTRYNMSGQMEKYYIYKYDDYGDLTQELWYDADSTLEYKIVNEYDSNGRKTETYTYDGSNNLQYKYVYQYDNKGDIIDEVKYDNDGNKVGVVQYIYKYYE